MVFIQIGNYSLPAPTAYSCDYEDLDSDKTTRNERGYLKRDRLRADMFKISASFRVHIKDLSAIANAVKPKTFSVKVFDLTTGNTTTKTMYASSKHAEIVSVVDKSKVGNTYVDYSFNLIEC